jgi:hypothetical protein
MANFLITAAVGLGANAIVPLFGGGKTTYQTVERGKEENFQKPLSRYGEYIPQVWGKVRVPGILIWASFPPREEVSEEVSRTAGGKGQPSTVTTTRTYKYFGNCAFLLSQSITEDIPKIWFNGELLYENNNINPRISGVTVRKYQGYGTINDNPDPLLESFGNQQTYRKRCYVVFENLPLEAFGNRYPQISAEVTNGQPNLSDIISDILEDHGYESTEYDVSELNEIDVPGFKIDREMSCKEKLGLLQQAYFFEMVDTGDKLKFITQYRPTVSSAIPLTYLASHEDGQQRPENFQETVIPETQLPTQIEVGFADRFRNYQDGLQRSPLFSIALYENKQRVELPISLSESEAKSIANKQLLLSWVRRRRYKFSLPPSYSLLEPGDVVEVPFHSEDGIQVQISRINHGANDVVEVECFGYQSTLYDFQFTVGNSQQGGGTANPDTTIYLGVNPILSFEKLTNADGSVTYELGTDYTVNLAAGTITILGSGSIPPGSEVVWYFTVAQDEPEPPDWTPSDTILKILDIPKVYDSDGNVLYVLADGDSSWRNASLYVSRNGGVSYNFAANIITRSIFGDVLNTLADGTTPDSVNDIDIQVPFHAVLETVLEADLDAGENVALVGNEILQFRTTSLTGNDGTDRLYTLSNLRRGLRGTYAETATHTASEEFFLLSGYLVRVPITEADIGETLYFKAITPGQTLDDVDPVTITVTGETFQAVSTTILDFSPRSGDIGTVLTIYGSRFTGATSATVNGTALANLTIVDDSTITGEIDTGTTTGKVSVIGPAGTATSLVDFVIGPGADVESDIELIRFLL